MYSQEEINYFVGIADRSAGIAPDLWDFEEVEFSIDTLSTTGYPCATKAGLPGGFGKYSFKKPSKDVVIPDEAKKRKKEIRLNIPSTLASRLSSVLAKMNISSAAHKVKGDQVELIDEGYEALLEDAPRAGDIFLYNNTDNPKDFLNGGHYQCLGRCESDRGRYHVVHFKSDGREYAGNIRYCETVIVAVRDD